MFYWLQMSDSTDANIPVALCTLLCVLSSVSLSFICFLCIGTNGGPGCSGLAGALIEQGAFRIQSDGTLDINPGFPPPPLPKRAAFTQSIQPTKKHRSMESESPHALY